VHFSGSRKASDLHANRGKVGAVPSLICTQIKAEQINKISKLLVFPLEFFQGCFPKLLCVNLCDWFSFSTVHVLLISSVYFCL
jgi:hypothetical protein